MINRFGSPVISMHCIRLLPIVSGVTIVSISFLQSIAVPPYPLGMRNGVIGSLESTALPTPVYCW